MSAGECDIAIIGMTGRFPGAPNIDAYWNNLWAGVESISTFPPQPIDPPGHVPAFGKLADVELFDAAFFGFTPGEAEKTDPQHRLFLECAHETFEDAGYDPRAISRPVGVFAGTSISTYLFQLLPQGRLPVSLEALQLLLGNDKDYLATRVAYKLGLTGPAISVQTACSTSLVAVVLACQSLLQYTIDYALAGGVSISLPQDRGYQYEQGGILSPDGRCRAFDASAQGTVPGNGVGAVLLKRAADAVADGDHIRAIIKGFAINNDGAAKIGYTAPGVKGQAAVIREALAMSGIDPATISYIEAHGTGTSLGDPIELAALVDGFGERVPQRCAIGSVKSNIGHLNSAAGIAGLIKLCAMLEAGCLPPSLHFERPNPALELERRPFYVQDRPAPWTASPRRAGLSSFGFGGTNAHVVVEAAPACSAVRGIERSELFVLSARTRPALEQATDRLASFLESHGDASLPDVAYTLQVGRQPFRHRRAFVASSIKDAIDGLRGRRIINTGIAQRPLLVFMYPGQGVQHVDMARSLYEDEPLFREAVDAAAKTLRGPLGFDVREVIHPKAAGREEAQQRLAQTGTAQPALLVIELALTRLLAAWGVKPDVVLGHSVGEIAAACAAGVLCEEDALRLIATRARLMQAQPSGGMLAVFAPAKEIAARLPRSICVAAYNSGEQCVLAGPHEALIEFAQALAESSVRTRLLTASHAFHSPMMDPVVEPLRLFARNIPHASPKVRMLSNVSGDFHPADRAVSADYFATHVRAPVLFERNLSAVFALPASILLEVGPGRTLAELAAAHGERLVLSTLAGARGQARDREELLASLARLWPSGIELDFPAMHAPGSRLRLPLPTYPFQRERYWIDLPAVTAPVEKPLDVNAFVDLLSSET
jgi:acyl transferase domain-containing protein